MSTNHRERVERVVAKALKAAAREVGISEEPGFYVSTPAIWPVKAPDGSDLVNPETGEKVTLPAWFLGVTIRGAGLTDPDIGNGFPVYGILPDDASFTSVARGLLDRCLHERNQANTQAMIAGAISGDEVLKRLAAQKDGS